jgi:lipooligosaccharide transport system ATP-binding protein
MSKPLVSAKDLTKKFGDFIAVDSVSFEIHPGEAFGFLGPNGAGKTSTMKMISSVSPVTSGELKVFGLDPGTDGKQLRSRLGVVPQEDNLDMELTVAENLYIYGRYHDLPRAVIKQRTEELLAFAELTERANAEVNSLSGGMKRRLTIARALINDPDMVILDEPTTGLDPQARHVLWDRLYRLKREGATLIITTHYMDEAEQLCDRLVVMDKAKIVAEGSPPDLIQQYAPREVVELRFAPDENERHLEQLDAFAARIEALADRVLLYTEDADKTLAAVHDAGIVTEAALVRRSTLEDVFLRLTGRGLTD